jgi:hypothetical protein
MLHYLSSINEIYKKKKKEKICHVIWIFDSLQQQKNVPFALFYHFMELMEQI